MQQEHLQKHVTGCLRFSCSSYKSEKQSDPTMNKGVADICTEKQPCEHIKQLQPVFQGGSTWTW
jgi:hypothetical protein